jgi:hypothetical protein
METISKGSDYRMMRWVMAHSVSLPPTTWNFGRGDMGLWRAAAPDRLSI